jgi:hypothetical protein
LEKINRLLHKSGEQMPIFGQICTKRVNFTPDLGFIGPTIWQNSPNRFKQASVQPMWRHRMTNRIRFSPNANTDTTAASFCVVLLTYCPNEI